MITQKVTGAAAQAGRWGDVQVTLIVRKTTTTVGSEEDGHAEDRRRRRSTVPEPHRSLGLHQPAGAARICSAGGRCTRAEREHPDLISRRDATRATRSSSRSRRRSCSARADQVADAARVAPGRAHHGHADRRRRPRRRRRRDRASSSCSTGSASWTRRSARTRTDSEISRLNRGELRARPTRIPTCAPCSSAARSCASRRAATSTCDAAGGERDRSVRARQGLVGRSRRVASSTTPASRNYAVNVGGDMRLRGRAVPEPCWSVGIQHPLLRAASRRSSRRTTSRSRPRARYARGEPRRSTRTRGAPPTGVLSVTIAGPELATADAYATAAFAMGEAGPHWTARLRGLRGDDDPRRRASCSRPPASRPARSARRSCEDAVNRPGSQPTPQKRAVTMTPCRRNTDIRHRILVVDDEPSIVDAVATALRYEDYDVEEAATGREALAAVTPASSRT